MHFCTNKWTAISNNVVCASTKGLDQSAHMRSLIRAYASCLKTIDRLAFGVSKLKRRPHRFVPKFHIAPVRIQTGGIGDPPPPPPPPPPPRPKKSWNHACPGTNVYVGLCWCCSGKKMTFDLLTPSPGSREVEEGGVGEGKVNNLSVM